MNTKYLYIFFQILLLGCSSLAQAQNISPQQPIAGSTSNAIDGIALKKISDIDQRLKAVRGSKIEDVAKAIAEVDDWPYVPEDEKLAREKIDIEIEKLRTQIEAEVMSLLKTAIDSPNGNAATEKMSKINTLLSFYPAPETDEKIAKLEQITSNILNTSRQIEDIRRLRYNEWAVLQIKSSLEYYRHEVKVKVGDLTKVKNLSEAKDKIKVLADKDALMKACIAWMSPINPAFLEPAVMDLYNHVYGLTKESIGDNDEYLIKLAQGFANPSTKRKALSDF